MRCPPAPRPGWSCGAAPSISDLVAFQATIAVEQEAAQCLPNNGVATLAEGKRGHGQAVRRPLLRRNEREGFARPAVPEVEQRRIRDVDRLDIGESRPFPAAVNHSGHRRRRAGEQRLDGTVTAIAHPPFETEAQSLALDSDPETNSLHRAADHEPFDFPPFIRHRMPLRPLCWVMRSLEISS
jgi:hypothetical protein